MSVPKRLCEEGTPPERSIVGFGREEAPPDDLERKIRAAVARSKSVGTTESRGFSRWLRPRSIGPGVVAVGLGAVVLGAVIRYGGASPASTTSPPSLDPAQRGELPAASNGNSSSRSNEPSSADPSTKEETGAVAVTPDSLPSVPVAPAGKQPPIPLRSTAAPSPASSASIAREVELLDAVTAKLERADPAGASRDLDSYDAEFPRGTLRMEATALRIRTLLMRGDRSAAEKLGAGFLATHPNGVHAKRIRVMLAEPSNEAAGSRK